MCAEIDWCTARSPGGGPGGEHSGHGAEEHVGVLPAVEGDWLRGPSGAGFGAVDCRSIQMLAPSLSLSLSPTLLLCVYLRLRGKNNSKERRKDRRKGWMEKEKGVKAKEGCKSEYSGGDEG